jgi:hypothetical protein
MTIALPAYSSIKDNIALKNDAYEIVNALRLAQNRSVTSKDLSEHGVYFDNDKYILFSGDWPGASHYSIYNLKWGVTVYTGVGDKIKFSRLTGVTTPDTIVIGTSASNQKTITINEAGKITLD